MFKQPQLSSQVRRLGLSPTYAILDSVREMRARGIPIVDLNGGEPDFDTPTHIVGAAKRALDAGLTHYTASRGDSDLLQAISKKLRVDNGIVVPSSQIIVTPSAKHGLYVALATIVEPGDEVIVLTPAWVSYSSMVELLGGRVVEVPAEGPDFRIDRAAIRAALSQHTKAIVLNTPNNPTGHVLTREEAQAILDIALEANICVIADEIYEKIIFDGASHVSLGSLPDAEEHVVTVNGFSKAYAMTGWRIGYLCGSDRFINQALKVQQHTVGCTNSFVQRAAIEALSGSDAALRKMVAVYARRRAILVDGLNGIDGVCCRAPQGSFYTFADFRGARGRSSPEGAQWLLQEALVAATPGSAFGRGGEGFIRFSFATADDVLREAIQRIREACQRAAAGESAISAGSARVA